MLLTRIRRANSRLSKKNKFLIIGGMILILVASTIIDYFVPFNSITNTFRGAIALTEGLLVFSAVYLYVVKRHERIKEKEPDSKVLRERFSHKERINISIVMWAVWFLILLFTSKENLVFTNLSSALIASALGILTFVRSTREEDAIAKMGLEDSRDLKFEKRRKEEEERRKNEDKKDD